MKARCGREENHVGYRLSQACKTVHFCLFPTDRTAVCANLDLKETAKGDLHKTRLVSRFAISQYRAPPEALELLRETARLTPHAV